MLYIHVYVMASLRMYAAGSWLSDTLYGTLKNTTYHMTVNRKIKKIK